MTSLRFVQEKPSGFQSAYNLVFYRPGVLVGVAVGGLTASLVAMVYYFQSNGALDRLRSGQDSIRFEKGLLVLDRGQELGGSGMVKRVKILEESPATEGRGGEDQKGGEGGDKGVLSIPLPVLSFAFWAILTAGAAITAYTKSRLDLQYRQFVDRVGFSLNILDNGKLKLRTVGERALNSMMMGNPAATKVVLDAAKKTKMGSPFLQLPPNESYVLMKAIFNELSPISATGFFHLERFHSLLLF